MKNFNIDQVEDINTTLDTILGLAQTINDLVSDEIILFTDYPSKNKGKKYRADRLGSKLLALSDAGISTTEQAQEQINTIVNNYYHTEQ